MKTRKKFTDNVRQMYAQHKDVIQNAGFAILLIAIFISGFLLSWNFMMKPLNDGEFELCEQVARDVYYQKWQALDEAPENVSVTTTSTTITVRLSDTAFRGYRGNVVAKLQNGELVITRNYETVYAIIVSIMTGILFIALLYYIGTKIYVKNKQSL